MKTENTNKTYKTRKTLIYKKFWNELPRANNKNDSVNYEGYTFYSNGTILSKFGNLKNTTFSCSANTKNSYVNLSVPDIGSDDKSNIKIRVNAGKIIWLIFSGREIEPGNVVKYKDGNSKNINIKNLYVGNRYRNSKNKFL